MTEPAFHPCEVELEFADGTYLFRLPLKMIAELQTKCGAGIGRIYARVASNDYRIEDLTETLRCGLIGGGTKPAEANRLIDVYCDKWPLAIYHQYAFAILLACVHGYEPNPDKPKPEKPQAVTTTTTDGSTSPPPI